MELKLSGFYLSSNFIRLKNMEVGYTFPRSGLLNRASISSIRIYANGNNLVTWSKSTGKGIDPESTDSGGYGVYPITRTFVFGANIRF